ncbi:unnamed protein product [Plutella xylostella]|uniref:(diamondback moth) hypothetical protein n=1 Tax=Plutella xylostella TaxID=51655 RepID=A0A8S4FW85_PLUXY|nr:unnamed protein product [Plutella xylostella]
MWQVLLLDLGHRVVNYALRPEVMDRIVGHFVGPQTPEVTPVGSVSVECDFEFVAETDKLDWIVMEQCPDYNIYNGSCKPVELGFEVTCPADVTNGEGAYREEEGGDALPTDMSDTDSEPDKHHNSMSTEKCWESHEGRALLAATFAINIDTLFTLIFTSSKLYLELLAARNTRDFVQASWQHNAQSGLKCRQISYTLGLSSGPIGPKEVYVTETQVMNKCSKPGVLYSIDVTSENAGIPYADAFTVEAHYCLRRAAEHATAVQVFGQIKYKKTLWPMVKGFLEKNAYGGLEDYLKLLEARLTAEAEGGAPAKRKGRRRRRAVFPPTASTVEPILPTAVKTSYIEAGSSRRSGSGGLVAALILLLLLNAVLYWRLYHATPQPTLSPNDLHNRMSSLSESQMADWSNLLERHTRRQRSQLLAWRDALDRAVAHLAQTEQALTKLLETIKPSLERAQRDASDDHGQEL